MKQNRVNNINTKIEYDVKHIIHKHTKYNTVPVHRLLTKNSRVVTFFVFFSMTNVGNKICLINTKRFSEKQKFLTFEFSKECEQTKAIENIRTLRTQLFQIIVRFKNAQNRNKR